MAKAENLKCVFCRRLEFFLWFVLSELGRTLLVVHVRRRLAAHPSAKRGHALAGLVRIGSQNEPVVTSKCASGRPLLIDSASAGNEMPGNSAVASRREFLPSFPSGYSWPLDFAPPPYPRSTRKEIHAHSINAA